MDDIRYPIGHVARRTGLTVSAIRYYSDEGIVAPAGLSSAGHREYDLRGIAQLELIRTLRDLGAGLDEIRRLLSGETGLPQLLAEHLALVERQERGLRARRAVLRALTRQEAPAERAALMHKLVGMSDEEREQLVDDFWAEAGSDLPADFAARLRSTRPRLPDDPTAGQLESWIELADLLGDAGFRAAVRTFLRETHAAAPPLMTSARVQDFLHEDGHAIMEDIVAACRAGLPPASEHARDLATRLLTGTGALAGVPDSPQRRERLASAYRRAVDLAGLPHPEFDATHGRYLALVSAINGTTRAPDIDLRTLGPWLATALTARG